MSNFYLSSEQQDDLSFLLWAELLDLFTDMLRLPLMSRVDWICTAKSGKKVNCELKGRRSLDWDTLFIEPGKWNYLVDKWNTERIIPLYINMCDDLVYVFDLRKVGTPSVKHNVRIWDKGALCYKYEDRYELSTDKAYKYKNGKLFK